jgi:hypothetical protein
MIKTEQNKTQLIKEELIGHFKKWLEVIGINPEFFTEEQYQYILITSLFSSYQMQIQEAIAIEQLQREQVEKEKNNDSNKLLTSKNSGKIITPNFHKKRN